MRHAFQHRRWRAPPVQDQASGSRSDRAGLANAQAFLRPGDCLIVWKLAYSTAHGSRSVSRPADQPAAVARIDAEKLSVVTTAPDGGATKAGVCRTFGIQRGTLIGLPGPDRRWSSGLRGRRHDWRGRRQDSRRGGPQSDAEMMTMSSSREVVWPLGEM